MFKPIVLVAFVASANAGVLTAPTLLSAPAGAVAVGPALGATLLGRINAPETTIVKQQVVVDQPEIRLRAVPTLVQAAPQLIAAPQVAVAKTVVQPQLVAQQLVPQQLVAAPQVAVAKTVVQPQLVAQQLVSAPQVITKTIQPQLLSAPLLRANSIQTIASPLALSSQLVAGVGSQTLLASPTGTILAQPTVLALKK